MKVTNVSRVNIELTEKEVSELLDFLRSTDSIDSPIADNLYDALAVGETEDEPA